MIEFDLASYLYGIVTTWIILIVGFWISNNFGRPPKS